MGGLLAGLIACASCEQRPPAAEPAPVVAPKPAEPPKPRVSPAARQAVADALEARAQARARVAREAERRLNLAMTRDEHLAPLLQAAYEASGQALYLVAPGGDLARARALLDLLRELPDHAVDGAPYRVELIEASLPAAQEAQAALAALDRRQAEEPRFGPLLAALGDLPEDAGPAALDEGALALGLESGAALAGFGPWLDALEDERVPHLGVLAELDAHLLRAMIRWVGDFQLIRRADPFEPTKHPLAALKRGKELVLATLVQGRTDPVAALRALEPVNPLYRRTIDELKRHRGLAQGGTVKRVPGPVGMKRGARGPQVKKLQERLAAEGYFTGTADGLFGADLEIALKDYQTTHQLDLDGVLGKITLASLNKPMETRVEQIELSLQRWRESRIKREHTTYARVNLPQFELELWDEGHVIKRHRVVVGNTNIEIDDKRRLFGPFNYSRMLESEIENIVLNPKWRVPDRITMDELELELIDDPAYFENHAYEIETKADGTESITQGSGDANALGRIKLNFQNPFAIYLHDTPQKPFFERTIRAFSHGCMRVHQAVDLGYWLLERFAGKTREEVDKIYETLEETSIVLPKPIPIYVEYNTVSVDDCGRAMFFIDIYHYDWAFWKRLLPYRTHLKLSEQEYQAVREKKKAKGGLWRGYFETVFERKFRNGTIED